MRDHFETLDELKARISRTDRLTLAKIGLNAVIDEATGYQEVRPPDALRKMLPGPAQSAPVRLSARLHRHAR